MKFSKSKLNIIYQYTAVVARKQMIPIDFQSAPIIASKVALPLCGLTAWNHFALQAVSI